MISSKAVGLARLNHALCVGKCEAHNFLERRLRGKDGCP